MARDELSMMGASKAVTGGVGSGIGLGDLDDDSGAIRAGGRVSQTYGDGTEEAVDMVGKRGGQPIRSI